MISTLELRFIPRWLNGVTGYYNGQPADFEKVISKHDARLHRLANHLFMSKLKTLGVADDFRFPDAEKFLEYGETYNEDDAVFALYGPNPARLKIGDFNPTRFKIFSDKGTGALFVDDPQCEEQNIYEILLKAISFYVGKPAAYQSACFRNYLKSIGTYEQAEVA